MHAERLFICYPDSDSYVLTHLKSFSQASYNIVTIAGVHNLLSTSTVTVMYDHALLGSRVVEIVVGME